MSLDNIFTERVFADRYKILEKIGSGGMADVYRALDRELDRKVAIKVLHHRHGQDAQFVERFRREARSVAQLNHPNIVQVYDWGKEGDTNFLVMELLDGQTLKQIINDRAPMSSSEAISIGLQACAALDYAHDHKVIHRDVKPHNIVISPAGQAKVTDFGIAQAQTDDATVTQEGFLLGTAQYCSPEQAQGRPVVRGSDIYSLGIVMYEMLTGTLPFDGDNPITVAMSQVNDEPTPPSQLRGDIPTDVEAVVMRALSKSPDARFATAGEMSSALERARENLRRGLAGAATTTLGSGVEDQPTVAIPLDDTLNRPSLTDFEESQEASKRNRKIGIVVAAVIGLLLAIGVAFALVGGGDDASAETVDTPDLTGLTLDDAQDQLNAAGLSLGSIHQEPHETAAEGTVFIQDPNPTDTAEVGSKVEVWVSTGQESVTVPNVVGETLDNATDALQRESLRIGDVEQVFDDEVTAGEIMSQDPRANASAAKDSEVDLTVSKGLEPDETVIVPSLLGLSKSAALSKLNQRGLVASEEDEFNTKIPVDTVARQTPQPGDSVRKGSAVTIFLSRGPQTVKVPDLVGLPQSSAERQLRDKGLEWQILQEENDAFEPGSVIAQDIRVDTIVSVGSTIVIILAIPLTELPPGDETPDAED